MTIEELREANERADLEQKLASKTGILPTLVFDKKPKMEEEPTLSPQAQIQLENRKKVIEKVREEMLLGAMGKEAMVGPSSDYKQSPSVKDPLEMRPSPKRELSSETDSDMDRVLLDQLVSEVSSGNLDGPIQKEIQGYKTSDPERYKRFINLRKLVLPKGISSP
jgi:hypothetical protein